MATKRSKSTQLRIRDDVSLRPTIPIQKPSGRYRWAPTVNEQETVPPPGRVVNPKFEVKRTIKRRLKP